METPLQFNVQGQTAQRRSTSLKLISEKNARARERARERENREGAQREQRGTVLPSNMHPDEINALDTQRNSLVLTSYLWP